MGDRVSFATDIGDILERRAAAVPERRAYTFLVNGKDEGRTLSYGELYRLACMAASVLRQMVNAGDRVLLMHDDSLDFIVAFMACIFARVAAVPIPPPDRSRIKRTLPRIQSVIADCSAVAVLANRRIREQMQEALLDADGLRNVRWLALEDAADSPPSSPLRARPGDLAFLQYTSGSTSAPKGVMVSHGNILDNLHKLQQCFRYGSDSATVTWMPYFHDYGLIDGLLEPLYAQAPCHIISPVAFIKRPWCWLDAVSKYHATHIHGPNFAYELCLDRTRGDRLDTLDLSCLEVAGCAAEPIRHDTARRFIDTFARCGFREKSFFPAYGMAEATLVISAKGYEAIWSAAFLAAEELEKNQCVDVAPGHPRARAVVACGVRPSDFDIAIVEPETSRELSDNEIGEIWLSNPSVAMGYWNRPEETRDIFHAHTASGRGPMLRTGDLGFMRAGEIYVTGRLKDLVIVNGNNHYPQDIEQTVEAVGGIRPTFVAAFSLDHPEGERLVIVAELARREEDAGALIASMRSAVSAEHEISCWAILLLPRGSILKTSSGKVQRNACRQAFLSDQFTPIAEWRAPSPGEATANAVEPSPAQEWEAWLRHLIAELKHIPETHLDPTEPFTAFGLSSVEAVQIAGYAEERMGRSVPATALWEYPNIRLFARFLSGATDVPVPPHGASFAEPVAIIGMACKFPGGADSLDDFWNLLSKGESVFSDPPAGRFPQNQPPIPAAYIHDIFRFDAEFFGISDAEARTMDPQQRLLLETAWHALEDAGTPPAQLAGMPAGVFIGISSTDYAQQVYAVPGQTDRHAPTGTSASVIANRLSYFLDLRGPSLTIDTACSASLVAVNQACLALQSSAARIAIAGGVNALLSHGAMVTLREARMLSPTGRCRPFDTAADGYVRGEGCGVIVLKKLADARLDGNRIWAIIHGSEVVQDGRSNGLTAPSGLAQHAVVRGALARAGIAAGLVEYVEAHGTGTVLGDSIELRALAESYGRDGSEPCRIGAVKSCVGHLEGAAGIAGLIKTVLALSHETIPPNPLLTGNGVHADICGTRLALVTGASAWPVRAQRRFAAVSSFGFGGTLVHVVLSDDPHPGEEEVPDSDGVHLLAVSARNSEALRTLLHRYAQSSISTPQLCAAAAVTRTHFACRAAFVFRSRADLFAQLSNFSASPLRGNPGARIAFVFNGAFPRQGLGHELCERFGVFKERVDALGDRAPGLLRFHLGLIALWQSWGVGPDVVFGEGGGEYAAAVAAGVLSPEAAARLAVARDTPAFADCLRTTPFARPIRPIFSSSTGLPLGEEMASPEYWLHRTGAAAPSVEAFHGIDIAIEMNAAPVEVNRSLDSGSLWISCLDPDRPETESLLQALSRVYAAGVSVRWDGLYTVRSAHPRLPLYPFSGREHRIAPVVSMETPVLLSLAAGRIDDVVNQLRTHDLLPDTAVETLKALSVLHVRQSSNIAGPLETWFSEWVPVNIGAADHGTARPCVLTGDGLHRDQLARAIDRCARLRRVNDTAADNSIVLIYCRARDEEAPDEAALRLATDVLGVLQALRAQQRRAEVWAVTQGLREGACVWGLGKTAALEMPDLWGGLVDLPSNLSDIDADNLLRMISGTGRGIEDQLCLRDGQWFASRLVSREIPKCSATLMLRPDAVYWIPGGTGTLGGHVVRMLRERGARHIIVSARSEGSFGQPGVRFVRADVCSRSDIARVLAEIDATRMPLAGIAHVAGTVTEFPIESLTPDLFRDVAAAKVTGAWNLHESTQGRELDFFVCFSSIASLWGAPGQAHYAAANHFLDNICLHRRGCGQPALAINWGPWSGGGMVTPERLARLSKAGLDLIHPGEALELLGTLMAGGASNIAAARLRWERFGPAFTARRRSPFLSNFLKEPMTPTAIASRPYLLDNWRNASPDLLRRRIRDHIRSTVAEFLGEGRIPETDRGFFDMGLDSLSAVAIRNRLVADFSLPLSNADVFNFPNIDALTAHILDLLVPVQRHEMSRDLINLSQIDLSQTEMMNSIAHDFEMLGEEDNKD